MPIGLRAALKVACAALLKAGDHPVKAGKGALTHLVTGEIGALKGLGVDLVHRGAGVGIDSVPGKKPCIVINPRVEDWTTENLEAGRVGVEVWYKGELLSAEHQEYYVGENVDELLSLHLYGPQAGFKIGGENIYAVFKVDGEAKKLLVVTPPTK